MPKTYNTNLKNVAFSYLDMLKVKATAASIKKSIEQHPYYPSLLCLSDTFSKYHVSSNAYEINTDDFTKLEPPFIAYKRIPNIGNDFVLVTEITEQNVKFLYKRNKIETIEKNDFLKHYQKIVFAAESNENSGEKDYHKNLQEEKANKIKKIMWSLVTATLLLFVIGLNIPIEKEMAFSILALIKLSGTATAILLLIYETDKNNAFIKNICSTGKQTNCDAVLRSKASKIYGISWSELGFFYFAATSVLLLFPNIDFSIKTFWLVIANAFVSPYIVFSIYYQWRIVKQWCPLCLTVQSLLLSELIWSVVNFWTNPVVYPIQALTIAAILFCFLFPLILWYVFKPIFTKSKDHDLYLASYKRLQYNPDVFKALLYQQPKAPEGWEHLGINIGNPTARNTIIKVCNPYCTPCARAHTKLEEIVLNKEDIQLKIIFLTINEKGWLIAKHLLAIAAENNIEKIQKALDEWYSSDQVYEDFAAKYPMNGEINLQQEKLDAMTAWWIKAEVSHTPSIYINGYLLPENYQIEEIHNIL